MKHPHLVRVLTPILGLLLVLFPPMDVLRRGMLISTRPTFLFSDRVGSVNWSILLVLELWLLAFFVMSYCCPSKAFEDTTNSGLE